jgi:hypothetical protein
MIEAEGYGNENLFNAAESCLKLKELDQPGVVLHHR